MGMFSGRSPDNTRATISPFNTASFGKFTVRSTNAPTIQRKPLPSGIGRQALCDLSEDVDWFERRLSQVIWPELKQDHSRRRKFSDFLNDLMACGSDDVDLSYLILMTKKFGVCDCQPVLVPLRYAGDDWRPYLCLDEDEARDRSFPACPQG